jgi:hypothetical protein
VEVELCLEGLDQLFGSWWRDEAHIATELCARPECGAFVVQFLRYQVAYCSNECGKAHHNEQRGRAAEDR